MFSCPEYSTGHDHVYQKTRLPLTDRLKARAQVASEERSEICTQLCELAGRQYQVEEGQAHRHRETSV